MSLNAVHGSSKTGKCPAMKRSRRISERKQRTMVEGTAQEMWGPDMHTESHGKASGDHVGVRILKGDVCKKKSDKGDHKMLPKMCGEASTSSGGCFEVFAGLDKEDDAGKKVARGGRGRSRNQPPQVWAVYDAGLPDMDQHMYESLFSPGRRHKHCREQVEDETEDCIVRKIGKHGQHAALMKDEVMGLLCSNMDSQKTMDDVRHLSDLNEEVFTSLGVECERGSPTLRQAVDIFYRANSGTNRKTRTSHVKKGPSLKSYDKGSSKSKHKGEGIQSSYASQVKQGVTKDGSGLSTAGGPVSKALQCLFDCWNLGPPGWGRHTAGITVTC